MKPNEKKVSDCTLTRRKAINRMAYKLGAGAAIIALVSFANTERVAANDHVNDSNRYPNTSSNRDAEHERKIEKQRAERQRAERERAERNERADRDRRDRSGVGENYKSRDMDE